MRNNRTREKTTETVLSTVILCALAAGTVFFCVRYELSAFLLYLVVYILLPGLLLSVFLFPRAVLCWRRRLLLSFYAGAVALVGEFYLLCAFGAPDAIAYVNPLLSLVMLAAARGRLRGKTTALRARFSGVPERNLDFLLVFAAAFGIAVLSFSRQLASPQNYMIQDYYWHMGNVGSLASEQPLGNFHIAGAGFKYHYFADLLLAAGKRIFGWSAWTAVVPAVVLYVPLLSALAFSELITIKNKYLKTLVCVALMRGASLLGNFDLYEQHLFTNVNGVGVALPGLICAALLVQQQRRDPTAATAGLFAGRCVLLAALAALLTGLKGPFGVLLLAGYAGYLLLCVLSGNAPGRRSWLLLAAVAAGFAAVYLPLLSGASSAEVSFSLNGLFGTAVLCAPLAQAAAAARGGLLARAVMAVPSLLYYLGVFGAGYLLCLAQMLRAVLGKRRLGERCMLFGMLAAAGITAAYIFTLGNANQLYFLMGAAPFAAAVAVDECRGIGKHVGARAKKVLLSAAVALLCVSIAGGLYRSEKGIRRAWISSIFTAQRGGDYISDELYDGLMYIREETPADALVATDKRSEGQNGTNLYFLVSAYGERACFLEGYDYDYGRCGVSAAQLRQLIQTNNALYAAGTAQQEKYNIARSAGINYIFVHRQDGQALTFEDGEYFTAVFQNSAVAVFAVNGE